MHIAADKALSRMQREMKVRAQLVLLANEVDASLDADRGINHAHQRRWYLNHCTWLANIFTRRLALTHQPQRIDACRLATRRHAWESSSIAHAHTNGAEEHHATPQCHAQLRPQNSGNVIHACTYLDDRRVAAV